MSNITIPHDVETFHVDMGSNYFIVTFSQLVLEMIAKKYGFTKIQDILDMTYPDTEVVLEVNSELLQRRFLLRDKQNGK